MEVGETYSYGANRRVINRVTATTVEYRLYVRPKNVAEVLAKYQYVRTVTTSRDAFQRWIDRIYK